MNICVVGVGYVGLVTGACFAEKGNNVWCIDTDEGKIENLRKNVIPIYEYGLEEMVVKNSNEGRLRFLTELSEAVNVCDVCFIAVGTPQRDDGSTDTKYLMSVVDSLGNCVTRKLFVIIKSTVPVGTNGIVMDLINTRLHERGFRKEVEVISNPEFLTEGMAIKDCMNPDRIVAGAVSEEARGIVRSLYRSFADEDRILFMDPVSAEITKYTANTMLAARISLMNEISRLCDAAGGDIKSVKEGISLDKRIGPHFLNAGCGYGGSCFPKDVRSLANIGQKYGLGLPMVRAIDATNDEQKKILSVMIERRFGEKIRGIKLAVLGLSYKPGTDDMRSAPSIVLINSLLGRGARVSAFDPAAREQAVHVLPADVDYAENISDLLTEADAAILVTEWPDFTNLNWAELGKRMNRKILFDGRNIFDPQVMAKCGFEYYCIGRGHVVP